MRVLLSPEEKKRRAKEACKRWAAKNPDKIREYCSRHNAKRKTAQRAWGKVYWRSHYAEPSNRMRRLCFRAKARAKEEKLEFEDSLFERLTSNPPKSCECCSKPLDYSTGTGTNENRPSLDRVENTKGYTDNNVYVICYRCNRVKNNGTAEEHEIIARYIRRHSCNA